MADKQIGHIMKRAKKTKLTKSALGIATAGIIAGSVAMRGNKEKSRDRQESGTELNNTISRNQIQKNLTFGEYKEMLAPITPYIMLEIILNEGVELDKTGKYCVPYKDSLGVWTIAFGITTTSDGKKVSKKTKPIPIERAWDESVHFLETRETYFLMYCYDVGCENLHMDNAARACAFASVFYNSGTNLMEDPENKNHRERNETLRNLYKKYGDNITADMVRECFAKYPIVTPRSFGELAISGASDRELANVLGLYTVGGRGLWARRWLEGQILMGNITPEDFLNLPIQSTYEFFRLMGEKRDVFWTGKDQNIKINMETLPAFTKWVQNPVTHDGKTKFSGETIRHLLMRINPTVLADFDNGKYELGDINHLYRRPNTKTISDSLYFLANADFLAGDYASAAEKFETLATKNPNNAQIFNDLATTYNNMGEYKRALTAVNHIIKEIKDKSAFAAAYYNAGVSREGLGEYSKALINYNRAIENGNKSQLVSKAIKRIELNQNLARQNKSDAHI